MIDWFLKSPFSAKNAGLSFAARRKHLLRPTFVYGRFVLVFIGQSGLDLSTLKVILSFLNAS